MEWEEHIYFAEGLYNDLRFRAHSKSQIIVDMDYMIAVDVFEAGYLDYFALTPIRDEALITYSFFIAII